jgi:hypothetical protein
MAGPPGRPGLGQPARPACSVGPRDHGTTTRPPPPGQKILKDPRPDEYPLIVSLLLVNKKLSEPALLIIGAPMMAGRAGKLAAWLRLSA